MNVFELFAKITLDTKEYKKGLQEAAGKMSDLGGKLKSGAKAITKATLAGVGAASAAVGKLTQQAVTSYADYEQLVGGVETLFGAGGQDIKEYAKSVGKTVEEVKKEYKNLEKAQTTVLDNAAKAYTTAGLSQNEYMETVTSFAAALTSSLDGDTVKAADVADMAIQDMADNANKMGTDMEMIQNAYQGFAKQNYTMLDNLKLGYGGTAEEMARLVNDSGVLGDSFVATANNVKDIPFDQLLLAIHEVQDQMGITGTTAAEASETISGSLGSAKAAWDNLVAGLANPSADLGGLIDQFVQSAAGAAHNLVPIISQALSGIGKLIQELAPVIAEELPAFLEEVLPSLLEAGGTLLQGLINGLLLALPNLIDPIVQLVLTLGQFIIENLPLLLDAALQIILALANGLAEMLPELMPTIVSVIMQIVETLIDNVDLLIDAALKIIVALADGLIQSLPTLLGKAPTIISKLVTAIIDNVPQLLKSAARIVGELVTGIIMSLPEIVKGAAEIIATIAKEFVSLPEKALEWGKDLITGFLDGIKNAASKLWDGLKDVAGGIADFIGFSEPKKGPLSNFHTYAPDMMDLFASGIKDNAYVIQNQLNKSLDFDIPTQSVDFAASGMGNLAYTTAQAASAGGAEGGVKQPVTIIVQLASGLEIARQMVDDINQLSRINGAPVI